PALTFRSPPAVRMRAALVLRRDAVQRPADAGGALQRKARNALNGERAAWRGGKACAVVVLGQRLLENQPVRAGPAPVLDGPVNGSNAQTVGVIAKRHLGAERTVAAIDDHAVAAHQ